MQLSSDPPDFVQLSVAENGVWVAGVTVTQDKFHKIYSLFVPSLGGIVKSTTLLNDELETKVKYTDKWMRHEDPEELPKCYKETILTDKFRRGQILSLKAKNIRALSDVETGPSPGLNLLCSPNGTGKTSLLQALSLTFFTEVAHLDSSRTLQDFVKIDERKAEVEVVIFDPDQDKGTRKFKREIHPGGRTKLFDDGTLITVASLKEIRESYEISLTGMNRAVEWDAEKLLEQAVESLGETCKLGELEGCRADARKIEKIRAQISKKSMQLKTKERELKEMEPSVKEAEEVKEQSELKEVLEYLVYHKETEHLALLVQRAKEKELSATEELEDVKDRIASFDKRLVENHKICQEAKLEVVKAKRVVDEEEKMNQDGADKTDQFAFEIKTLERELKEHEDAFRRNETEFKKAEMKALEASSKLQLSLRQSGAERGEEELGRGEKSQALLRMKHDELDGKASELENDIHVLGRYIKMLENRLESVQDVSEYRTQLLEENRRFRGVSDCTKLVKELSNEEQLRMNVYGPVAAEIDCDWGALDNNVSRYHARILESCVSGWYTAAFVCECDEDAKLLVWKNKERCDGWCPDTIVRPPRDHRGLRQARPVDGKLRSLGIDCVVNDFFSAPDSVRDALNAHLQLQNIYVGSVGSELADENMESLKEEVKTWYTPRFRYNAIRSRYDDEVSLRIDTNFEKLNGIMFLGGYNSMKEEKKKRRDDLQQALQKRGQKGLELMQVRRNVGVVAEDMRGGSEGLAESEKKMAGYRLLRENNALWQRRLADRKKEREQLLDRLGKVRREIAERQGRLNDIGKAASGVDGRLQSARDDHRRKKKTSDDFKEQRRRIEQHIAAAEAEVVDAERKVRAEAKRVEECAVRHTAKRRGRAEAVRGLTEAQMEEGRRRWAKRDMGAVVLALERAKTALRGARVDGAALLARRGALRGEVRALREALRRAEGRLRQDATQPRARALAAWLDEAVAAASARFARMCDKFGWRGALRFERGGGGGEGAAAFGLRVVVDGRPLTAQAASGGEHTVLSTLLCLALDTRRPFRVMDEVGQALDDGNLKRVIDALVLCSYSDETCPQLIVAVPRKPENLFHPHGTFNLINATSGVNDLAQ